jgi:probable HAF family extracellular repeat protein
MHRSLLSAVLSLSVLLSTLVAAQGASYTFTTIDVPGAISTWGHGINAAGQVVGYFLDDTGIHGFVTDGAEFTTLDGPDATQTEACGINAAGQIVGYFFDAKGYHGFVSDGVAVTTIDVPGGINTWACGINDSGQIVGGFRDGAGRGHGFVKDGTEFTRIDVPGAIYTNARGINDSGEIVGFFLDAAQRYHGFVTNGVTFTPIDAPSATRTFTYGINTGGQIVGGVDDATGTHAFVATPVEVDTVPPVITVSASPTTLWPPNGKLVTVTVSGTITDEPDGSRVSNAAYRVMDEYGQIQPSGNFTPEADDEYSFTVELQASRRGNDRNGRQYTIEVSATDHAGNPSTESVIVTVPHNQSSRR